MSRLLSNGLGDGWDIHGCCFFELRMLDILFDAQKVWAGASDQDAAHRLADRLFTPWSQARRVQERPAR
jgi:hypothetical protein